MTKQTAKQTTKTNAPLGRELTDAQLSQVQGGSSPTLAAASSKQVRSEVIRAGVFPSRS